MRLFEPIGCKVDLSTGAMANATGSYQKRFRDLDGLYADAAAFEAMRAIWGERIVYEVSEFRPTEQSGDLIFGVTRMAPGKVGDEYFMTRGHIHNQADRPEIYYGQKGRGLMLMESPEARFASCRSTRRPSVMFRRSGSTARSMSGKTIW